MPGLGQRLRHRGRFSRDFTQVHRCALHRGLGLQPRQGEQVFRDRAETLDFAHRLLQRRAAFLGAARPLQRDLQPAAQDGQRRAQFMSGFGDKALLRGGREFQALEQLVDGGDELSRFVVDARERQALAQIARPDAGQCGGDLVNRGERPARHPVAAGDAQREDNRDDQQQRASQMRDSAPHRRGVGAILQRRGLSVHAQRNDREAVAMLPAVDAPIPAPQERRAGRRRCRRRRRRRWPPAIKRTRRPGPRSFSWLRRWRIRLTSAAVEWEMVAAVVSASSISAASSVPTSRARTWP